MYTLLLVSVFLVNINVTPGNNRNIIAGCATAYASDFKTVPSDRNVLENMDVEQILEVLQNKLRRSTTLSVPISVSDENIKVIT